MPKRRRKTAMVFFKANLHMLQRLLVYIASAKMCERFKERMKKKKKNHESFLGLIDQLMRWISGSYVLGPVRTARPHFFRVVLTRLRSSLIASDF